MDKGWALVAAALVLGCGTGDGAPDAAAGPPKSPEEKLYEGVRSASFQLDSAIELVEATAIQARLLAKDHADPGAKQDLDDLAQKLDRAVMMIQPHRDEPPPLTEFSREFSDQDEKRLKAVEDSEKCARELAEARETVAEMLKGDPDADERKALENMASLLKDSEQAVVDSVQALKA